MLAYVCFQVEYYIVTRLSTDSILHRTPVVKMNFIFLSVDVAFRLEFEKLPNLNERFHLLALILLHR